MRRLRFCLFAVVVMLAFASTARAPKANDVVLVLDVSNSMWGQIDGIAKIEIAREVIAGLVADWSPDVGLGLVAYGHRRERDCGDIELVVPVAPIDPAAFTATVNALVPRGRTPLTEAVRLAAETLGYRDNPATVVLVSDGIETCDADPCALATDLENAGASFVTYVVGFDVTSPEEQAQLACIAENSGGLYLSAGNAEELSDALADVAEQAAPPAAAVAEQIEAQAPIDGANVGETMADAPEVETVLDAPIVLEAIDDSTGTVLVEGVTWSVTAADQLPDSLPAADARPQLALPVGDYVAVAMLGSQTGEVAFTVEPGVPATHRVHFPSTIGPASLSVENAEIPMSGRFAVAWEGPDAVNDVITIVTAGADASAFGTIVQTAVGNPAALLAPDRPGAYEVRYVHGPSQSVLASLAVTILEVPTSLSVPDTVVAGGLFAVAWQGPNGPDDAIALVPAGALDSEIGEYRPTAAGSPSELRAAGTPGDYEVRYVSAQSGIVLASHPVRVQAQAALQAPNEAFGGSHVQIAWTGPANPEDRIVVAPTGAEARQYGNSVAVTDGSPTALRMPDTPGAYEIRYVIGSENHVLAAVPITVIDPPASLAAAEDVVIGSEVPVAWTGPDNDNDRIVIATVDAVTDQYSTFAYTRDGTPADIVAPGSPGNYEIRYLSGQSARVLATRPLTVQLTQAQVQAPESVVAGSRFEVSWSGPDNDDDRIAIVAAGDTEGLFADAAATGTGSPAALVAPDAPGTYEVRYVTGQDQATLAAVEITVVAAPASLQASGSIGAGGQLEIAWTGPANGEDLIVVSAVGAPDGEYLDFYYAIYGSPAVLSAPDEPGAYEVRYMTSQDDATLASIPLAVTPVSATLQAPATVGANEPFEVIWTGPANHVEDRIVVVEAGADQGLYVGAAFAQDGSPATLYAPATPGAYEVRYMTGWSDSTLAAISIEVTP